MKIVIIGDGKVGHKLTTQLSEENYDVVLIDQNEGKLKEAVNKLDIFCITGNGADVDVQRQADVPHADLVIACASTDELSAGQEIRRQTYDCTCTKSDLLSTDRSVERRSASEYGSQSGKNSGK